MSIIFGNCNGWILCHKTFLERTYQSCVISEHSPTNIKIKGSYFNLRTPILMNSSAEKIARSGISQSKIKQKKKKKPERNTGIENYHSMVVPIISEATNLLIEIGKSLQLFEDSVPLPEEWLSNNSIAREAARSVGFNTELLSASETPLFHTYVGDKPTVKTFYSRSYILPPHCSFLLCDIKHIDCVIGTTYDVIVMDPPWQNKSVRRKRGYSRMDCEDLLTLPVHRLTKPGSLIVVWATNNEKQLTFIKEKLFPHWGVNYCADWHWVKVTQRGAYIHSLESTQNKPYENLIIGRCPGETDNKETGLHSIEAHKVIVSVPSSIHSHKPPLVEILKPYLPENATCLELFARYLLPGWTSCGNEVLKLQDLSLFDEVESNTGTR